MSRLLHMFGTAIASQDGRLLLATTTMHESSVSRFDRSRLVQLISTVERQSETQFWTVYIIL